MCGSEKGPLHAHALNIIYCNTSLACQGKPWYSRIALAKGHSDGVRAVQRLEAFHQLHVLDYVYGRAYHVYMMYRMRARKSSCAGAGVILRSVNDSVCCACS